MSEELFQIDPKTSITHVTLNVFNLPEMTAFYQSVIGLTLLKENDTSSILGIKSPRNSLLTLEKSHQHEPRKDVAGLYHTAFLLPTRLDLGNALTHLLKIDVPLAGGADHGYSEALYLNDPEGNGIEIYRDKPRDEWDIKENGFISGITAELNAASLLAESNLTSESYEAPLGTSIGHIHLSVISLEETATFYQHTLGFHLTDNFGKRAKFFAAGAYHHHIGTNTWHGKRLHKPAVTDLGLASFTLTVTSPASFLALKTHLKDLQTDFTEDAHALTLVDPNGLTLIIEKSTDNKIP